MLFRAFIPSPALYDFSPIAQKNIENYQSKLTLLAVKPYELTPTTVDPTIFDFLRHHALSSLPQDRRVILTFEHYHMDELRPKEHIEPNETSHIPKYLIIFTIRIINKNLYQPIACVFWNRQSKSLATLIQIYINALYLSGLYVISTVCIASKCFIPVVQQLADVSILLSLNVLFVESRN